MRNCRFFLGVCLFLSLCGWLGRFACAEETLTLSADTLCVGDHLRIEATDGAPSRTYTLFRDGEQINTGEETDAVHAAMNPQEPGRYELVVQPVGGKAASVRFTVYGQLSVTLSVDRQLARTGDPILWTAHAEGGAPSLRYEFSVWRGTERIAREITEENEYQLTPFMEGTLTVSVIVTDGLGHTVSAVAPVVSVEGGGGLSVSGDMSPLLVQGGIRSLTINSPGPWSAKSEAEEVTLLNTCGDSGDALVFAVSAAEAGPRSIAIELSSLGLTRRIVLRQTISDEEEEDVYLFREVTDWVTLDGRAAVDCLAPAEGDTRRYRVEGGGAWQVSCDAPYIQWSVEGEELTVTVDRNSSSACRNANVYVRSGEAEAVLGVAQPGAALGASVLEVRLNRDRGQAYQDQVEVSVITDLTADSVALRIEQRDPIVWTREIAEERGDSLRWRFSVPMTGAGAQSWLFYATNPQGSAAQALATISVSAETAAFTGTAEGSGDGTQISVDATQGAEVIQSLDAEGNVLHTYTLWNARVDRAADVEGRFVRWTLPVTGERPAAVLTGDQRLEVRWPAKTEPQEETQEPGFRLYSQEDGTWRNKTYRHSTLEQSGCAIFALSHALQLLGHTEPESQPEQLAVTYAFCLVDGGTLNSTLVGNAAKAFGFKSRFDLFKTRKDIVKKYKAGAVFSFAIVQGHIALTDRLSDDGTMCHIIDSAPSATFSRIKGETPYRYDEAAQTFVPLNSPAELPGILYYVDTEGFDAAEYWLPLDYVVERGVRLIQRKAE